MRGMEAQPDFGRDSLAAITPSDLKGLPSASKLRALIGIEQDLNHVVNACQRLDEIWDADPDGILVRALWSSALVAYARCFKSGRRLRLPADTLDVLGPAERELHGALLDERDKHIAHQVDDLERVLLSVVGRSDGNTQTVEGVAVLMAKQIGPPREKVAQVRELAAKLKTEAAHRREAVTASLLAEAQDRFAGGG